MSHPHFEELKALASKKGWNIEGGNSEFDLISPCRRFFKKFESADIALLWLKQQADNSLEGIVSGCFSQKKKRRQKREN